MACNLPFNVDQTWEIRTFSRVCVERHSMPRPRRTREVRFRCGEELRVLYDRCKLSVDVCPLKQSLNISKSLYHIEK